MTLDLKQLQREHREWLAHNVPNQLPHAALLGVQEEVGELSHAHLKMEQGIRGDKEKHTADKKDAIGDIVIFLSSYCNTNGFDLEECVEDAWAHVKKRDWIKDPEGKNA